MAMDRWLRRRQRRLAGLSCAAIIALTVAALTLHGDLRIEDYQLNIFSETCVISETKQVIESVCSNFSNGLAFGSLCAPLCLQRAVHIKNCLHHGTTVVLFAVVDKEDIVIKKKRISNLGNMPVYFYEKLRFGTSPAALRKEYFEMLARDIKSQFGNASSLLFWRRLDHIVQDVFGSNISEISPVHLSTSFDLVGQNELMMLALFQNMKHIPKLKGTCGPLYAVEQSTSYGQRFPEVIHHMTWRERALLAREFLSLALAFQQSGAGPLHHCDMQEDNFGVTRNLEVRAIDVDLVYAEDRLAEILEQPACSSDAECDFFDCMSKCDSASGKCSAVRITNNLQILCRDIFQARFVGMGLLAHRTPRGMERELSRLLADCSSQTFGTLPMDNPAVVDMFIQLNSFLTRSLEQERHS